MKTALISGITGQDGSYLAELLLAKGYRVCGFTRQHHPMQPYMTHILPRVEMYYGDLRGSNSMYIAFTKTQPDELYNLGGQSFIPPSWMESAITLDINAGGLARWLEIVERCNKRTRVFQASAAGMFGAHSGPANEVTPMDPLDPYNVAKLAAHKLCAVYRARGVYVVGGILFSHESPRRGPEMVVQKICRHIARWKVHGYREDPLTLGSNSSRDWGSAIDYVRAMHLMLQAEKPKDYVIGYGQSHTIENVITLAMHAAYMAGDYWREFVVFDNKQARSNDLSTQPMIADTTAIHKDLGWKRELPLDYVIKDMVQYAIANETSAKQTRRSNDQLHQH